MFRVFLKKTTIFSTMTTTRSVVQDRLLLLLFDVYDHKHDQKESDNVVIIYILLDWTKGHIITLTNQPATTSMTATTELQYHRTNSVSLAYRVFRSNNCCLVLQIKRFEYRAVDCLIKQRRHGARRFLPIFFILMLLLR